MFRSTAILILTLLLSACGGGGGGSSTAPDDPPARKGVFARTVPGNNENITGFVDSTFHNRMRWQNLYRPAQIAGSGYITGISWRYNDLMADPVTCPSLTIRLSHSSLTTVSSTFADNLDNGRGKAVTVLSNKAITFPAGAKETWHRITFDTPFYYNGTDSLVVDFTATGPFGGRLLDACDTDLGYTCVVFDKVEGSLTGTTDDFLQCTRFHFEGGDCAFVTDPNPNSLPFTSGMDLRKLQVLYRPEEVGGSGPIRGLGFQVAEPTLHQNYTFSMKVGHTTLSELGHTFADNFNAGAPVTVADQVAITIPAGIPAGGYVWIPWTGAPFTYNGTDNLLIELEVTDPTGVVRLDHRTGSVITRILAVPGSAVASQWDECQYGVKFRFAGGNLDVITSGEGSVAMPFRSGASNKSQHLYRATELGTRGRISKLALRARTNVGSATDYGDFTVRIGHAGLGAVDGLKNNFASNLAAGSVEAFRGTFTVPANIRYGDWVEIPLTTPFTYDTSRDLVLQISSAPGSSDIAVSMSGDSAAEQARYADGHAAALDSAAESASTITDGVFDLRLVLE